jgi:soluble lytic murein transglycosylase-like protein
MVRFGFVTLAQRFGVEAWKGLCALALSIVPSLAHAQIIEIFPDGSIATYAGPVISGPEGIRSIPLKSVSAKPATPPSVPTPIASAIHDAASRHQLSERLVEAVAWQESRLKQSAVSPKGARGVMQLMPKTAEALGVDAGELNGNVDGGAAYLAQLMRRFDGNLIHALAAYDAGPANVSRYGGVPPFSETRAYVDAILERLAATSSVGERPP